MQRFLITNTNKFTGQAEVVYNEKNVLIIINCSDTDMTGDLLKHFKAAVPVNSDNLADAFAKPTVIVQAEYQVTFDMFYNAYPLKRNRFKAEKLWPKLSKADQVVAYFSLDAYKKYLKKAEWQSPMIADSYLSRREFETNWKSLK